MLHLDEDVAELSCEHSSWHLRQIHIDETLALSSTACSGLLSVVFAHGTRTHCMDPNGGKESIDGGDDDDDDDDETDWFGGDYFSDEDEESHSNATDNVWSLSTNGESPCHVMRRLGQQEGDKDVNDYKE